jgi:predicted 3-demethylubiquinone-9 3-methyltransferase (glyoxalase superfamily)
VITFCTVRRTQMSEIRAEQKITPFLMFRDGGEAAVRYYVSVFKSSKIHSLSSSGGKLMHASFELEGQRLLAMDGGEYFRFEQGISLFVDCQTQEEVDRLWEGLSEGGSKEQCGWVKDRWGISWQIVPSVLGKLMGDRDPVKAKRVVDAMLRMRKLVIKELQEAYDRG